MKNVYLYILYSVNSESMKKLITIFFLFLLLISCNKQSKLNKDKTSPDQFSFAFLTDIHLTYGRSAPEGFAKAINTVNKLNPDFVLTGGDLILDALETPYESVDSLYDLYLEMIKGFKMQVYNTIGNHEHFGLYLRNEVDTGFSEYGKRMYEHRIGKRYYSFDYKGWHFMVLDAVGIRPDREYIGLIDDKEIEWIKSDLQKIDKKTPIAISVHIPFITAQTQLTDGSLASNPAYLVINNARDVLLLFREYNLKLVLQGHLHFLEDIYVNEDVHFITGGAVSGKWWNNKPTDYPEEGFVLVKVKGEEIDWDYIDYGWTPPHIKVE
jgi:Icc protein